MCARVLDAADPCDYWAFDFDHRDRADKIKCLSETRTTIARIDAELAKCDMLCANCHMRRTRVQLNWTIYPQPGATDTDAPGASSACHAQE